MLQLSLLLAASVAAAAGNARPSTAIVVEFTLCDRATCVPLREGGAIEPGIYTLNISATLAPDQNGQLEPSAEPSRSGSSMRPARMASSVVTRTS